MNALTSSSSSSSSSPHTNRPYLHPTDASSDEQGGGGGGGGPHHRLTPQEAAVRGASLAFQKQRDQADGGGIQRHATGNSSVGGGGRISRQTTGGSSYAGDAALERERERERQALFLSPSSAASAGDSDRGSGGGGHLGLSPASAANKTATVRKSASFIAATLAASRSASPAYGTTVAAEGGGGAGGMAAARRSPLREPLEVQRGSRSRRGGSGSASPTKSADDRTDTTSLAPATSLISLFENRGEGNTDPVKSSPRKSVRERPRSRSQEPPVGLERRLPKGDREIMSEEAKSASGSRPKPSPKPKPKQKPKVRPREQTPSPPPPPPPPQSAALRRSHTEIVSPIPRRPKTKPQLEAKLEAVTPINDDGDDADKNTRPRSRSKAKPKISRPQPAEPSSRDENRPTTPHVNSEETQKILRDPPGRPSPTSPSTPVRNRPQPGPRKSVEVSERMPLGLKKQDAPRQQPRIPHNDGQEESRLLTIEGTADARPSTASSRSSNDSFVSATSEPTRDDTDPLRTTATTGGGQLLPHAVMTTLSPKPSRPRSAQPSAPPAPPMRRSVTGSSQLTVDSLSNAIMAGSLASARHTPVSLADSSRTPPPVPPSRRKGGAGPPQPPRRMKHTLRQPISLSDDEDTRRPQHHKRALNNKKHAHHEGSRRRWREEITEREKKRYEAVWASNRGLFLVQAATTNNTTQQQPVRNESYEELSGYVANVVVRDIWARSRLPAAELAEVWDLVYGQQGQAKVHAALDKREFVVGMWLIDQRLRGRKIPPRVSDSVWDSAKGLRVLDPGGVGTHGHGQKGKGR